MPHPKVTAMKNEAMVKQQPSTSVYRIPVPKASTGQASQQQVIVVDGSDEETELWVTRSLNLPAERRNGWVVAWILETHHREAFVVEATGKQHMQNVSERQV